MALQDGGQENGVCLVDVDASVLADAFKVGDACSVESHIQLIVYSCSAHVIPAEGCRWAWDLWAEGVICLFLRRKDKQSAAILGWIACKIKCYRCNRRSDSCPLTTFSTIDWSQPWNPMMRLDRWEYKESFISNEEQVRLKDPKCQP